MEGLLVSDDNTSGPRYIPVWFSHSHTCLQMIKCKTDGNLLTSGVLGDYEGWSKPFSV